MLFCGTMYTSAETQREELHVVAYMAPNLPNACPASGFGKAVQANLRMAVKRAR